MVSLRGEFGIVVNIFCKIGIISVFIESVRIRWMCIGMLLVLNFGKIMNMVFSWVNIIIKMKVCWLRKGVLKV